MLIIDNEENSRLIDSMKLEQQASDDRCYNQEALLPEHECLKFDTTNETPTANSVEHLMEVECDGENHPMMTALNNESIEKTECDTSDETRTDEHTIFGFSRMNYMNSVRSWSTGGKIIDPLPALVRSSSGSLSSLETDDTMSSRSGGSDDDAAKTVTKGVTFNETVRVMPIPPLTAYTAEQRFKMYANRFELKENKARNKKEFQFDGYNWRNATEECHMAICPLTGEILHPVHL